MLFFKVSLLLVTLAYLKETQAQSCGLVYSNNNVKIVGGVVANRGSWPSIAFVSWNYKASYKLPTGVTVTVTTGSNCGGTLIARDKVLTAAHCVPTTVRFTYGGVTYTGPVYYPTSWYSTAGSSFSIYLGLQDKTSIVQSGTFSAPTVKASVSSLAVHPSFSSTTLLNDIALLKLTTPVTLNNFIQLACLPTTQSTTYVGAGLSVYAAGWGLLSSSSPSTPNLLYNVKLSTYAASSCPYSGFNSAGMICAGWISGGKGICQGDSGGPLYYLDPSSNKYILVGITSFTNAAGCGRTGAQNGFTRVSNYLSWINSQTQLKIASEGNSSVQSPAIATPQIKLPSLDGTVVVDG